MKRDAIQARRRGRRLSGAARRRSWPAVEALEPRIVLSNFTVDLTTDNAPTAGGVGSGLTGDLRYCITQANADNQPNTIVFDSTVFGTQQTITLGGSQLELADTGGIQTITGPASGVTIGAGQKSRVLQVGDVTASISGLTLTQGGNGGILNDGILTLTDCTASDNSTPDSGGGIANEDKLTLIDCTVSGNTASIGGGIDNIGSLNLTDSTVLKNTAEYGGGIENRDFGTVGMINCTVSGNHAFQMGGGVNLYGALTMTNCTVYDNTAYNGATTGSGGGIRNATGPGISSILSNCTIANNAASFAGGGHGGDILNDSGSNLTLNNCIVAYSHVSGGDIAGVVTGNNNLIDDASAAGGLSAANGNILSTNLLLAPPANYGGPTTSVEPLPGSPALGAGDPSLIPAGVTTDQRGASRTRGGTVDIGAFERGPSNIVVTTLADENNGGIDTALGAGTSLREAIAFANVDPGGGDAITFAPGLLGTLTLSQGMLPALVANVTIAGPGARLLTIDAQARSSIFSIASGATAAIFGLTLTGGTATNGGAISNVGTLNLTGCTLTGNTATDGSNPATYGGAIDNTGTLSVIASTISGNSAYKGGGIFNVGTASVVDSTLWDNAASYGGALYSSGSLNLADCTISGNSAQRMGGGIYGLGVTMDNTIVADSLHGGDIEGQVSGNNNLVDDAASADGLITGVNGNIVGVDPKLGGIGYNGGPTPTMALLVGSPAIDAGSNSLVPSGIVTDQRGAVREKGSAVDIGAFETGPSVITVTTLGDSVGTGATLREAIDYVNQIDPLGGVTITFAAGLEGTISLSQGMLPEVAGNMAIIGPGADLLTIDANGNSSIMSIQGGATVILSGLTLAGGSTLANPVGAPSAGGAIANWGNLLMTDCTVTGNSGTDGGGVANYGTLTMIGSTVSHNSTELNSVGGGLFNQGTMTLINSTVANNFALYGGGGLYSSGSGTFTLDDCTIAGNTAEAGPGAGIDNDGTGTVTLDNTIVADSHGSPGGDIAGKVSGSNNLIDDATASGGLTNGVNGNLVGFDPKLGALGNNGGSTQTMALLAGSPAIDKGAIALVPLFVTTDQRGVPRINGSAPDIGAVESGATTIVVTTLVDEDNGTISPFDGDGTSLREAISFASADPGGGDTIKFSPLLTGSIILSLGPLPSIASNMTIIGPGADLLTIDANGNSSIMSIQGGATVAVSGLTLAGGSTLANPVGAPFAGGAIANWGNLLMTDCTVTGNSGTDGGGVANYGTLTMIGSTVSHNSTELNSVGGGLFNQGTMTLINSTVANNFALYGGGGLYSSGSGTLTLDDCTIAGNTAEAGPGAGIDNDGTGAVTLDNTIVADSHGSPGGDIAGNVSGSNNLIDDAAASGGLTNGVNGNLVGFDPKLGALGNNGGSTQTMALLAGSLAIGAGVFEGVTTDQRGFALDSPRPDIGAFQYQGPPPTVSISGPATGIVQVQATFTLTATDPTPADQNGTFTYTIDWNGDGSDVETIQGPASFQVAHSFGTAGSYTPSVIVFDQDHRNSSSAALTSPVVVSALTTDTFGSALTTESSVTVTVSIAPQVSLAVQLINSTSQSTWMGSNSVNVEVTSAVPLVDTVIDPSSPSAQVTVSGEDRTLGSLFNVDNPFGGTSEQAAATIATAVALAVIGGAAIGTAGGTIATDFASFLTSTPGAGGEPVVGFLPNLIAQTNIFSAGIATGVTAGVVAGALASGGTTGARSFAVGGSPALIVEQGTVTWSNSLLTTATDAPTIIVKGGKLIPENDWIAGNPFGSQPLIEVSAGTLILGAPDGTAENDLMTYGSAPFIGVTGTGRVIVEPGNTFNQITSSLTAQPAGTTTTALVSSSPTALPGQAVTLTATVTAAGAPAGDGSVEFFDNTTGAFLGTAAVSDGSASIQFTPSALTSGDTFYATYLPTSGALAPSSGQVTQVVSAGTTTTLTGPASTPIFGQSVTFTATITDTTTGGGTPIGTVEFFDGTTDLGPGTPLNGSGSTATSTISTTSLTAGSHTIEAVFTPSSSFQGGNGFLSQVVKQATPTITWPSPTDIVFGTALSGTQLDAEATNPENGESVDGTFVDDPGQGTVLSAGSDESLDVTFTPSDTTDYASPVAFSTSINVTTHSTMTTLAGSTPEGAPGQTVTFTATVVGGLPAPYLPTGSVQFRINGVNAGSPVPLSASDTAVFSTTEPAAGALTVTAIYSGDTDFSGSPSPAFTEAVLTPGVFAVGSTLFVVGANTSDNALLLPWGSKLDGSTGLFVLADLNHSVVAKTFAQTFTAIDVSGYGGNDNILFFPTLALPTTVSEGNGNNLIVLANGQDTVTLGSGDNQVSGGDGNKTITVADTTRASTSIALGDGNNVISLGAGNDRVALGKGNDRVTAGNGNDAVFASGNGVDVVALGNGNDSVCLGDGSNTVTLGDGNDEVSAGNGNDNVTVGNGNDRISLGNGSDVIVEGNGNDSASAGNGSDLVVAGLGQHTILLGNGNDILIDGSATVVNSGDSLRQILTAWNTNQSTSVNTRLKVVYNTSHPNVLKAGSGRNWWFYTYSKDVTNKKSSDRLN